MKKNLLTLCFITGSFFTFAQTQPTPQTLPYSESFDTFTNGTGVSYPAGIQGWRIVEAAPNASGRTSAPKDDSALKLSGSAETTTTGIIDFNGKIGIYSTAFNDFAFVVALNTKSVSALQRVSITFDAMVMRNLYNGTTNNYINGLVFQYRVGTTSAFTNVNNSFLNNSTAIINNTGTDGVGGGTFNFILPADASNQDIVQVRWIMRVISGTAATNADRPSFAVDNITAKGVAPLPVDLIGFSGEQNPKGIKLNWSTASEINNDRFEILRSIHGKSFEMIGTVKGNANTNATKYYSFIDEKPDAGLNYYQLKQIDNDGTAKLSAIVPIKANFKNETLMVTRSKDLNQLNIEIMVDKKEQASIKLFDLYGRTLANLTVLLNEGVNNYVVPVTNLNSKIHIITLSRSGNSISKKFMN